MNLISKLFLVFYVSFFSYLYSDHEERKTQLLSTYETGLFDEGAAEITVFDPASGHILFVNAYQNSVTALDLFEDGTVSFAFEVSVEAQVPGGTANCLAVHDGLVAVAVEDGVFGAPGKVAFYSAFDGSVVGVPVEVGVMPDNVQFSPDGSKVITADEGEPNDDYTEDPLGSISIIDIVNGSPALTATVLTFASFEGTESALALEGGRVFGQIQVPDPAGSEWIVLGNEVWTDLGSHTSTSTASGLFFSEYAEGSSNNKYLEIYNGTGADVDLSGFSISTCNNGCDVEGEFDYPDNVTFAAGTIIANGDVFVMAHPNSDPPILAEADDISFSYFSNGDDFQALTLAGATANQYTIIDKIGDFGDDPGSGWTVAGVENATQNNTLKRNSSITSGNLDWSNSSSLAYSSTPSTLSQDLEPEYVAVSPNSETAYVVCQENNILAVVDLATSSVTALKGLGYKDHSLPGNGYDPTDRNDGQINIAPQPTLGMYQPDAMVSHTIAGATYVFTANEGDARDYDGYSEETRVEDLTLDPTAYPNAATLQLETALGRLKTTTSQGDMDGDGDVDQIYSYGARSFSIWDAAGNLVWDSGDLIEEVLADFYMTGYPGVDYSFDSRSDDKGPEPEAVEVATVDDQVYCFVGLERASGVMVFNVTDPTMPFVESYEPPSFLNTPVEGNDRETAPECVEFVAAANNITGKDLVIVANELTGSISINEFNPGGFIPNRATLTLLHHSDGESELLATEVGNDSLVGGVALFKSHLDSLRNNAISSTVLTLSSGDNFLPGNVVSAGLEIENYSYYDALALNAIGYDAIAIGNHDFDLGPEHLGEIIEATSPTPWLSANLDFNGEPSLQSQLGENIFESIVIEKGGHQFGIIGATTENISFITSPGFVLAQDVVSEVQHEINILQDMGVNKIILVSHLQGIEEEEYVVSQTTGIDLVFAGGGSTLLANEDAVLQPGDTSEGAYPRLFTDLNGRTVYAVSSDQGYVYIGKLIVEFDEMGEVLSATGNPHRIVGGSGFPDSVNPDSGLITSIINPINNYIEELENTFIATHEDSLDGRREIVRGQESSLGNLIADAYLSVSNELVQEAGLPTIDISFMNGGGIRNDEIMSAGDSISLAYVSSILRYGADSFLSAVGPLNAQNLKELMENAVSRLDSTGSYQDVDGTGRYAHFSGMTVVFDPSNRPAEMDGFFGTSETVVQGERIISIVLDDGYVVVQNGEVNPGPREFWAVTGNFLSRGGDQYPWDQDGVSYPLSLTEHMAFTRYLEENLDGIVSSQDYPYGGDGRIEDMDPNVVYFETPDYAFSGDTVEVDVYVEINNNPLSSFQIEGLRMQNTQPIAIELSETLVEEYAWDIQFNQEINHINVASAGSDTIGVNGFGVLFKVHFTVNHDTNLAGYYGIDFDHLMFNEEYLPADIYTDDIGLFQRGDVSINGDVTAMDASIILEHVVEIDTLDTLGMVIADVTMDDNITAMDASLVLQHVVGAIDLMNLAEINVPNATGTLNIQDDIFTPESVLEIPLQINDNGDIFSFNIEIEFDNNLISFQDFQLSELSENFSIKTNVQDGSLRVVAAGTTPLNIDGVLGNVYFNIPTIDVEELNIQLTSLQWNENVIEEDVLVATFANSTLGTEGELIPKTFALHDNYPNPFNPSTRLMYDLANETNVSLIVYDALGREIITLVDGFQNAGFQSVSWNGKDKFGSNVAAGIYIYTIRAGDFISTKKMLLLK